MNTAFWIQLERNTGKALASWSEIRLHFTLFTTRYPIQTKRFSSKYVFIRYYSPAVNGGTFFAF